MTENKKAHICVIGGGRAGLALISELRRQGSDARLTLIDKKQYFCDHEDLWPLLFKKDIKKVVDLNRFAEARQVSFVRAEVDRINFNKKIVYCKDKSSYSADKIVVCCGLVSRDLDLKGDHREGFFYFSDIDFFALRDHLSWVEDIVVYAGTFIGLRAAFYLSYFKKELKLLVPASDFLGSRTARVLSLLREKKIDVYENAAITEIVGEKAVKAVKTSLPKVFSAQLVCVDSGYCPSSRILDLECCAGTHKTSYEGVFVIGDQRLPDSPSENFYLGHSVQAEQEGEGLARIFAGQQETLPPRRDLLPEEIDKFIEQELRVDRQMSVV